MSDDWDVPDADEDEMLEVPPLDTLEGRAAWCDELTTQTDEQIEKHGGWIKAITIHDGEYMVARLRYHDGSEAVFSMKIESETIVVHGGDPAERN